LLEVIGKHDPQFHITKRASSRIDQIPGKRGDFLVDEILSPAQGDILELNVGGIRLFRGAERKVALVL
jgi:hypothetical protein